MSNERQLIELNATVQRVMFYNSDSLWGVYAVIPNNNTTLELNEYGNIVITGVSARLNEWEKYDLIIEPTENKKYGKGFNIVSVETKRPETIEEQQAYVKAIVTDIRFKNIMKAYPDHPLLDMFENHEIDYRMIDGFGKATYEKVRDDLLKNMEIQEALVELKEFDITYEATKKLIDHFGSASALVQKVRENIYNLCKAENFGFKKVDEYAINRGDDPESSFRIESALKYLLEKDASSGHSWIPKRELIEEAEDLLEIDEDLIEEHLEKAEEEQETKSDSIYIHKNRIALHKNYFFEANIKKNIGGHDKKIVQNRD